MPRKPPPVGAQPRPHSMYTATSHPDPKPGSVPDVFRRPTYTSHTEQGELSLMLVAVLSTNLRDQAYALAIEKFPVPDEDDEDDDDLGVDTNLKERDQEFRHQLRVLTFAAATSPEDRTVWETFWARWDNWFAAAKDKVAEERKRQDWDGMRCRRDEFLALLDEQQQS